MNTESLQNNFPDVYRDFYVRNDFVVSGCFVLPWVREAGSDSKSYFRFKTTIPIKCYVGINIKKDKNISFSNVSFFNINKKIFEKIDYIKVNKEENKIIDLLKKEFNKLGLDNGIEIEILSETGRGHGLGFSGVTAALISYGVYFLSKNNLKNNFLDAYFKEIFSLSGKMDFISRYGDTYGHNSIFTLKPNKGISCFYTDKVDIKLENIDEIDNIYYDFKNINKDNNIDLPFDYFLVFSGIPSDTKQIEYYKRIEHLDTSIPKFVKENIFNNEKDIYLNNFSNSDYVLDVKFNMINLQNLNALFYISELYKRPHDTNLVQEFIQQINSCRESVNFLETENNFAQDLIHIFKNNKTNIEEDIGVCQVYSGKFGGGYMVVTKQGISRSTITKTINLLKSLYSNVELEYISYIDGFCEDEVKIEQFISKGIYSKYIDKNKVIYQDNKGLNYLGDYSDIFEQNKGLILDMINSKIYFDGIKLTSKDIPSQNTTIEVLNKLLSNIGEEVSNKDFSSSSYTGNKNEMLGKIILPLLKFVEEKTGEKLSITCKGSITDFYLKMGIVNLKIGMIKKI